jgi:myo-inositol-1(or 4)-monophosphatase
MSTVGRVNDLLREQNPEHRRLGPGASPLLVAMARICLEAAAIARVELRRRDIGEIVHKHPRDFQTEVDTKVERQIVSQLSAVFPDHGIWGEENVADRASTRGAPRFLIDPIDGTTNFAWGIPFFGIVIARERDGIVDAGVVCDPMRDELFSAELGHGSWCNGVRMRATANSNPVDAVVGVGLPVPGQVKSVAIETYDGAVRRLMNTVSGVRAMGSSALALAYVACGRLDGFFEDSQTPLDYAASALMVQEAGGVVTGFDGRAIPETGAILAAGSNLHPWLQSSFDAPLMDVSP